MNIHRFQRLFRIFVAVSVCAFLTVESTRAAEHPMDGLAADEIERAIQILKDDGLLQEDAAVPMMALIEMSKSDVLAWQPGDPIQRKAFVNVRQNQTVYEADVNLDDESVLRWEEIPNVQSQQVFADILTGQRAMAAHQPWQDALAKRGYDDLEAVSCFPVTPGYFNLPEEQNRRIGRVYCYDKTFGDGDTFSHPIEGLYGVVDLDSGEVIEIIDTGVVPVSRDDHAYAEDEIDTRAALRPVR